MSFRKSFIPVNGSENSFHACEMAVRLAELGSETVVLAHCFDPVPLRIQGNALEGLKKGLTEDAEEFFEPCRELFIKAGIPYEEVVLFGKQGPVLAEAADNHNCDLIIMGTRGLGNVGVMVMGSVSNAVIHNTNLPVMLVPEQKKIE